MDVPYGADNMQTSGRVAVRIVRVGKTLPPCMPREFAAARVAQAATRHCGALSASMEEHAQRAAGIDDRPVVPDRRRNRSVQRKPMRPTSRQSPAHGRVAAPRDRTASRLRAHDCRRHGQREDPRDDFTTMPQRSLGRRPRTQRAVGGATSLLEKWLHQPMPRCVYWGGRQRLANAGAGRPVRQRPDQGRGWTRRLTASRRFGPTC